MQGRPPMRATRTTRTRRKPGSSGNLTKGSPRGLPFAFGGPVSYIERGTFERVAHERMVFGVARCAGGCGHVRHDRCGRSGSRATRSAPAGRGRSGATRLASTGPEGGACGQVGDPAFLCAADEARGTRRGQHLHHQDGAGRRQPDLRRPVLPSVLRRPLQRRAAGEKKAAELAGLWRRRARQRCCRHQSPCHRWRRRDFRRAERPAGVQGKGHRGRCAS